MAKRHATKDSKLELIIAVGIVLFMFLLLGLFSLSQTNNAFSQVIQDKYSGEKDTDGSYALNSADSEFQVRP